MPEDRARKTPLVVPCPRCGKKVPWSGNRWRPFCSERCKLIDTAAWAEEAYAIPSEDAPGTDEDSNR